MTQTGETRIQLCGRFVVRLEGQRVEDALPGARASSLRLLRAQPVPPIDRDELLTPSTGRRRRPTTTPAERPALEATPRRRARAADRTSADRARASGGRVRRRRGRARGVAPGRVARRQRRVGGGLGTVRPRLPRRRPAPASGPRPPVARRVAATSRRRSVARARVLRCGEARPRRADPPQADDCARRLIELAPFRESGYRILMEALEQRGNVAEALRVYDRLRILLRDELGIAPSPAVQSVYRRLLGGAATTRRLDLFGLREDVLARHLADEFRMVGGAGAPAPSPRARRRPCPRRSSRTRS